MSTKELEDKIRILGSCGYGFKEIQLIYRNKTYKFKTNNTLATDRLLEHNYISDRRKNGYYTYKQALKSLYFEGLVNLGL